jgi:uncharacterized membrane protein
MSVQVYVSISGNILYPAFFIFQLSLGRKKAIKYFLCFPGFVLAVIGLFATIKIAPYGSSPLCLIITALTKGWDFGLI